MTVINLGEIPQGRASEIAGQIMPLKDVTASLSANYLIKGLLGASALTVLFGGSNTGKTFVAVDLSLHVAAGLPWRGRRIKQGSVIYIAGEGGTGIRNRLSAVVADRPEFKNASFYLLPVALDLFGDADAMALSDAMPCNDPALIVIDTLARSMGVGDENSTKDMNQFIASCDLLRRVTGAHVMVVHHTGKDQSRGARGASSLYAATDTELKVTTEGAIQCTKQRDMPYPETEHFKLREVTLGVDDEGDEVTSAVVDVVEPQKAFKKPLSGKSEVAMQALLDALHDHGMNKTGPNYPVNRQVVHTDHWRAACDVHGLTGGVSDSAARTAFKRAKDKLMELDEIREWCGHVWRVQDED